MMKESETVCKTSEIHSILTQVIIKEDIIAFSCQESFKFYTEDTIMYMDYENICRKIIFNFILQMEDNLKSHYLFNFKILYKCMQTIHKNVSTTLGFMHVVIQDFKQIINMVQYLTPPKLNITYQLVIENLYTWTRIYEVISATKYSVYTHNIPLQTISKYKVHNLKSVAECWFEQPFELNELLLP
jgi:hypothetical protein